jgi:hypothetical protein
MYDCPDGACKGRLDFSSDWSDLGAKQPCPECKRTVVLSYDYFGTEDGIPVGQSFVEFE